MYSKISPRLTEHLVFNNSVNVMKIVSPIWSANLAVLEVFLSAGTESDLSVCV